LRAGAAELAQLKVALIVASLTATRTARAVKDIPVLLTGTTFLSLEVAAKLSDAVSRAPGRWR
jgi:ABC-type uncharacterized transport system substrate-binding protein